ncbi:MAG: hypothetical protein COC05_01090 [Gammaproteobacteria bacterium]|nr:MAG: hypothetical protein COC05_01090 [Gammaproteobacteria bacterium]
MLGYIKGVSINQGNFCRITRKPQSQVREMQPSFFDLDKRHEKLNERDALIWLAQIIAWEEFRETLQQY